jgi:hypothetical protein
MSFARRRGRKQNFDAAACAAGIFHTEFSTAGRSGGDNLLMYALFGFALMTQDAVFVLFGCTLFAAALFVYVFYQPGEVEAGEEKTRQMYLVERKEATYENLRDLNFEYKAGKLSEQDYAIQRASLEDEAAGILAELESIEKARSVVRYGTRRPGMRPNGGRA